MQIRITQHPRGEWTVVCGQKFHDKLGADEALWLVVNLMTGQEARYKLETIQEAMARASKKRTTEFSIETMRGAIEALREDQRLARIGPLED